MRQLAIHCTKSGVHVSGADNIGSTSDAVVSSRRQFMRVCVNWWNTYCERGGNFEREPEARNAVAMSGALEAIADSARAGSISSLPSASLVLRTCEDALKKPPRNCDFGTPDEQSERFDAHCRKHMGCKTCPLREADGSVPKHCEFAWGAMPCAEGGAS